VSAHIPSPCGRLSRPPSTMNMSDSLYAVSLPRLFLSGLPAAHDTLPEHIGSLLFLTLLSLHTTPVYPGGPFGTSPYRIAETVPSVLSSDTVESLLILIYAFSGLQLASGVTTPCGLQSSLCTPHTLRSSCQCWAIQTSKGHDSRYLHVSNTRYWWMATPSR
jgi:hypothetical protein